MRNFGLATSAAMLCVFTAACSSSDPSPAPTTDPASTTQTSAVGANTPAAPSAPAATIPTEARTIPVNVQGVAPVGVTVRVKGVELGIDATVLDVSASYGGTTTNNVALAGSSTYLLDEQGNKLMLRTPQDNAQLNIVRGQTMDGKLVFLGAVAPGAKSIKLVINDGNDGNSIIDPGLTITIPLEGTAG